MKSVSFVNQTVSVLEFGNKKVKHKNNIAYKQTGQLHPDYTITPNTNRYYDFKTDNTKLIYDEEEYKKAVESIINSQRMFYEKIILNYLMNCLTLLKKRKNLL